jgi:hypothetical protein
MQRHDVASLAALYAIIVLSEWCLAVVLIAGTHRPVRRQDLIDSQLFEQVAVDVRSGEDYYGAMTRALSARGYPTETVFNWRTPLLIRLIALAPSPAWARWLLVATTLAAAIAARGLAADECGAIGGAATLLLVLASCGWCVFPEMIYYAELWSGLLVLISLGAYRLGRHVSGACWGLVALFLRELALPYCVTALAVAVAQRRWREVATWLGGISIYVIFMFIHYAMVSESAPGAAIEGAGWVRLGGPYFLLATCRMSLLLSAAPGWCLAFYLPLSLLGFWRMRGPTAHRAGLAAAAYVVAFTVAGKPVDYYWGWLSAPLLSLGFALLLCRGLPWFRAALFRCHTSIAPNRSPGS